MEFRPKDLIKSYHVHVYYDGGSKQWAGHLRREVLKRWPQVEMGRWRDKAPQGPHPVSHYQIAFGTELFDEIVPFLAMNRKGLSMLVHPNTGDGYEDHAHNDMWIGPSKKLRLDALRRIEAEIKKRKAAEAKTETAKKAA